MQNNKKTTLIGRTESESEFTENERKTKMKHNENISYYKGKITTKAENRIS